MKPPIVYYGAKGTIAQQIIDLMPPHTGYIEPFAGSMAVLLAKPPVKFEVVNDLDQELMTFWRVLRDRPDDLANACALTPHSRGELALSMDRSGNLDDVEVARRVWVHLNQGRAHSFKPTGWHHTTHAEQHAPLATYMEAYRNRLLPAAARLLNVTLECRDAVEVIDKYGQQPSNLLYVDPPYLGTTRAGKNYRVEMADETRHRAMADALHAAKSAVMVSGYPSPLYDDDLFADWYRTEIQTQTNQAVNGTTNGRVEVLWSNRELDDGRLDFGDVA